MRKTYQYKKHMHVCVGVCTHTYTQNLFCIGQLLLGMGHALTYD